MTTPLIINLALNMVKAPTNLAHHTPVQFMMEMTPLLKCKQKFQ